MINARSFTALISSTLLLGACSDAGSSTTGSQPATTTTAGALTGTTGSTGSDGSATTGATGSNTGGMTSFTSTVTTTTATATTGSPTTGNATTASDGTGSGGGAGMSSSSAGGMGTEGTTSTDGSGGTDTTGAGGSGGSSGGSGGTTPLGNPPVLSAGCGTATTVTSGKKTITSTGQERTYIIDIPADYDMNTPHRLFYTSHWIGSTSEAVRDQDYYFLKPLAQADGVPAIFVAPQSDGATWQQKDHALFDDILAFVKENLCIDTSRVFATGFSFGGMITYSLSTNHQSDIRAAVGIAPANYNIWLPQKTGQPIAWMQTTGMSDGTCPWVNGNSQTQGAKYIAMEHAANAGCTVPDDIPTWQNGNHICYDFEGCPAEYPVKACTFGGGHTNIDSDGGSNDNWIARESWEFFMQF